MTYPRARYIILFGLLAILLISFSSVLFLRHPKMQDPAKPVQEEPLIVRDDLSLESLTRVLELSPAQVKRMRPILKQEKKRHDAILRAYAASNGNLSEAGIKQLEDFRLYYEKMYSHILNEEQFGKYTRVRKELGWYEINIK